MMKPHKHAALIKQWADGAEIEYLNYMGSWLPEPYPSWNLDRKYRIKPKLMNVGRYEPREVSEENHALYLKLTLIMEKNYNSMHMGRPGIGDIADYIEQNYVKKEKVSE